MRDSIYRLTLNMHDDSSQTQIVAKKNDSARKIIISLSDLGNVYTLEKGMTAVVMIRKPDGNILFNDCDISLSDNTVIYEFTAQTVTTNGINECEIRLYGREGETITSPRFTMYVKDTVYDDGQVESSDEFTELTEAITEVNRLDLDVEKDTSTGIATVTLTKKDGSTKDVEIKDGSKEAEAAAASASEAAESATSAAESASAAAETISTVAQYAENAETSADSALASASSASASASAASTSETNAATSETNAEASATSASESATSASGSATSAEASATAASGSASSAAISESNASGYASSANTSATNAASSSSSAAASAASASASASEASGYLASVIENTGDSEAWANGTINGSPVPSTHPAHNNNAEYWKDQAQQIAGGEDLVKYTQQSKTDAEKAQARSNIGAMASSDRGVANGVASLDGGGRIPYSQLPESAMEYKGSWNASTNTPTLTNGVGTNGDFYIVSVGGTWGGTEFFANDRIIYDGTTETWQRIGGGNVTSVAGKTGAVTLVKADVGLENVDNTSDLDKPISTATQTALDAKIGKATGATSSNVAVFTSEGGIQDSGIAQSKLVKATQNTLDTILKSKTTETSALATAQLRNAYATTTDLTAGTSSLSAGTICLVYEA